MPKVSVIIPSYNCAQYITDAVDCVLAQTYQDFEIVVVDDGSTDHTKDALQPYMNRIQYIYQKNKGLPGARNTGIKASNGEWITLLDADDLWDTHKLECEMKVMEDHPDVKFAFSDARLFNNEGVLMPSVMLQPNQYSSRTIKHSISHFQTDDGNVLVRNLLDELVFDGNPMMVACVIIKKEVFDHVGLFNEKFNMAEDHEMWLRICLHYDTLYLNKVLASYRVNDQGISGSLSQRGYRYAYGEGWSIDENYHLLPEKLQPQAKSRICSLYQESLWGYSNAGQHERVRFICSRLMAYGVFNISILKFCILSLFPSRWIKIIRKKRNHGKNS